MVVSDATGLLANQAIPISESTTAGNGLTLTGLEVKLGSLGCDNCRAPYLKNLVVSRKATK